MKALGLLFIGAAVIIAAMWLFVIGHEGAAMVGVAFGASTMAVGFDQATRDDRRP